MSDWVSVKERMPPDNKGVLLLQKTGYKDNRVVVVGRWMRGRTHETFDDFSDYCEDTDMFYIPEGWYEDIQNWGDYESVHIPDGSVTHWMPLPNKPEE